MVENNPGQPARADGAAWAGAETATGRAAPRHDPTPAGEGVSLAAATAAVITARWGATVAAPERASSSGSRRASRPDHAHSSNGHSSNSNGYGHATNDQAATGHSSNGHPTTAYSSNSQSSNGQASNGQASSGRATNGHAANGYSPYEGSGRESYETPAEPSFFAPVDMPAAPAMFTPEAYAPPPPAAEPYPIAPHAPEPYPPQAYAPERYAADPYGTERPARPDPSAPDPWAPGVPTQRAGSMFDALSRPADSVTAPVSPAMPMSPVPVSPSMPVSAAVPVSPPMPVSPAMPASAVAPPPPAAPSEPQPPSRPVETFDSIIGDLAFPEPFVPEPYEPYDPYHPKPSTAESELPQRIPGEPDVPDVQLAPNDPLRDPATVPVTESGDLDRIADFLQTLEPETPRRDGFDVAKVLEAVRGVALVADAQLRFNAESGHTLRIEFVDGADEGQVTREVARLLRETMGLDAAPTQPLAPHQDPARVVRAAAPVPTGRASVPPAAAGPIGVPGSLDHQSGRPLPAPTGAVPRVVVDHVQVTTLGLDATIEVQLTVSSGQRAIRHAVGQGNGPAVDAYLLRLAGSAAGDAIDQLLTIDGTSRARCYIEHVAVVPFAGCEVAVVVLLLVEGQLAEQLSGAAVVAGDPRQAVVRATLSAVNRRLESLLA